MPNKNIRIPVPPSSMKESVKTIPITKFKDSVASSKFNSDNTPVNPDYMETTECLGTLDFSVPVMWHRWLGSHSFASLFAISGDPIKDKPYTKFLPPMTYHPQPTDRVLGMLQLRCYNKGNKIFNLAIVEPRLIAEPYLVKACVDVMKEGKISERNLTWTLFIPWTEDFPESTPIYLVIEVFALSHMRLSVPEYHELVIMLRNTWR